MTFATLKKYNKIINSLKGTFSIGFRKFLGFQITLKGIKVKLNKVKAILNIPSIRMTKEV